MDHRDHRKDSWDVIVVGGGLAGLAAAATASAGGLRALVLEAHGPGGRARSTLRDGFTFNTGPHAFYRDGPGMQVLRSLRVVPDGAPPPLRRYRALRDGRKALLPTGAASLARTGLVGTKSKVQLARFLAQLSRQHAEALSGTSVTDWLDSPRLRPEAAAVVRALIRLTTYTADMDAMSADAALIQLQLASNGGVLYLHGGWQQLVERLRRVVEGRAEVRTGTVVTAVEQVSGRVEVRTGQGTVTGRSAVVATGGPAAVRRVLPVNQGWGDAGPPVTAACLDLGVRRIPDPGYVLAIDDPLYATVAGPPARLAPPGSAVVSALRYGSRSAADDRSQLEWLAEQAGVDGRDVVTRRFLSRLVVAGGMPRALTGGLAGRPTVRDTGAPGVTMAGDWVGPTGLLADAALASGAEAGRRAVQHQTTAVRGTSAA